MGEFNERMAAARHQADLSLMDVAFELRQLLPKPMWVSPPTLNRLERDTAEAKADPVLVCVLAHVYGVDVAELSPMIAERAGLVVRLLLSNRTGPGSPRDVTVRLEQTAA